MIAWCACSDRAVIRLFGDWMLRPGRGSAACRPGQAWRWAESLR